MPENSFVFSWDHMTFQLNTINLAFHLQYRFGIPELINVGPIHNFGIQNIDFCIHKFGTNMLLFYIRNSMYMHSIYLLFIKKAPLYMD